MRARVLLALLLVPAMASAQRRGGGGMSPRDTAGMGMGSSMGGFGARPAGVQIPSAGDLEKQSPVRVLLDKKKKLALTDSEVTQLQALAAQLKADDAPLVARADTLRKAKHPSGDFASMTDDERAQAVAYRVAIAEFMQQVRESQRVAAEKALALLSDEQKPKAMEVFQQQREEMRRAQRGPNGADGDQDFGRGFGRGGRRP